MPRNDETIGARKWLRLLCGWFGVLVACWWLFKAITLGRWVLAAVGVVLLGLALRYSLRAMRLHL